jgi:hypothetical protein
MQKTPQFSEFTVPNPVVAVIADALAGRHTLTNLVQLFERNGIPGEVPPGNKTDKCRAWLKRLNGHPNAGTVLGGILRDLMESPVDTSNSRAKISDAFKAHGLAYLEGGRVIGAGIAAPSRTLEQELREKNIPSVAAEFHRALDNVNKDSQASVTAACAILESLFKVFAEDKNLTLPKEQSIMPLWRVVQNSLGLNPASVEDDDLRRLLSGLISVLDGIGAFRTHIGSAHGRGRNAYSLEPRHARLVIHAAHTVVNFILETWNDRKPA